MGRMVWQILCGLVAAFNCGAALAAEISRLDGIWGSPVQCARALLVEGGSKTAEPFEIRDGWLKHGQTWCALTWFPAQRHADGGFFAAARATCGEDSQRHYGLGFRLSVSGEHDTLTIIWDEALINGPLTRCTAG